mmetsp:Transcript_70230/g.195467  ORF Transcript_70230/g.195467 Transcript_70230/m.195467 type:complete len:93 (-) Transcript_70230:1378-1656(-)
MGGLRDAVPKQNAGEAEDGEDGVGDGKVGEDIGTWRPAAATRWVCESTGGWRHTAAEHRVDEGEVGEGKVGDDKRDRWPAATTHCVGEGAGS